MGWSKVFAILASARKSSTTARSYRSLSDPFFDVFVTVALGHDLAEGFERFVTLAQLFVDQTKTIIVFQRLVADGSIPQDPLELFLGQGNHALVEEKPREKQRGVFVVLIRRVDSLKQSNRLLLVAQLVG